MSKRSRKKKLRKNPKAARTAAGMRSSFTAQGSRIYKTDDFQPDYTYVKEDLKRIGILAGSFVTLLIVLSFFLR